MQLSGHRLKAFARTLLMLLFFNIGAYAAQAGTAAVASMDSASSTLPCDTEDECLAELLAKDAAVRSRLAILPHDRPPMKALIAPVASSPSLVLYQDARASSGCPPSPLLLQICRLLF